VPSSLIKRHRRRSRHRAMYIILLLRPVSLSPGGVAAFIQNAAADDYVVNQLRRHRRATLKARPGVID